MSKSIIHLIVDSGPKQGETLDRKPGSVIRIGRVVKGNTLAIKDPSVSQKHLVIEFDTQIDCWALRDLESANGTFVNGERVPSSASVHLSDGDAIRIGGECSSISVKISVIVGNVDGIKGNGVKKGSDKSKKAGDCREDERNLMKDEIVDSGVESRVEEVAKRGRKRRSDGDLTKEEKLGSSADDGTEAKDLGRGRRKNPTRGSQENKILGTSSEDRIEERKNFGRSGKVDDCEQIKDRNCGRLSTKGENFDSVVQDETKESPKHLAKGRTRKSTRGSYKTEELQKLERGEERKSSTITSRKDEILPKVADDRMKAPEKLERGRKRKSTMVSTKDGVVNNNVDVPNNLTRRTRTSLAQVLEKDPCLNFKTQIGESFARDLIHNKYLVPAVDTFIDEPKNLRGRRRSYLNPTPKEDKILEDSIKLPKATGVGRRTRSTKAGTLDLVNEDTFQAPKNVGRGRRTSSVPVSKLDETLDSVLDDGTEVPKNLRRGNRTTNSSRSTKVGTLDVVNEDRFQAPKTVGRGRRTSSVPASKLDETLDSVLEDGTEAPKNLRRGKRTTNSSISTKAGTLDLVNEDKLQAPKKVGRGRRTSSVQVSKLDETLDSVLEDGTEAPKNLRRGKRTASSSRSTKAGTLDLVNEVTFQAPKNVGRGRRTSSVQVSKLDETSDSVLEDGTEAPKHLRRGKRTANSSKVSKTDVISDVVLENAVEEAKNVGRGKPRRAPARRTRASSRVSEDEKPLLCQSDKINQTPQIPSSPDLNVKRSRVREDKENNVLVKSQKPDGESTTTKNSSYENNSDEVMPLSGRVNKPSHVLPKAWNGNGIPNTTTKYKEDSKVSWHATPFEERLEKALSDERIFSQRKVTN